MSADPKRVSELLQAPSTPAAAPADADDLPALTPIEDLDRTPPAGVADILRMARRARKVRDNAIRAALQPELRKVLRRWNQTETAEILGVSRKTLERWIDEKDFPSGEREGRGPRYFSLAEINQIRTLKGLHPWRADTDECQVVSIVNFKGGVGKTTTIVPAAQYFARRGYRVLVIDADPQGSTTTAFGMRPDQDVPDSNTLGPFLLGEELCRQEAEDQGRDSDWTGSLTTAVQRTYWDGLDIIASNLRLFGAEFAIAARRLRDPAFQFYRVLHDGLQPLKDRYDVILVDTPPSLSFLTTNAIFASSGLVLPVPPAMMDFSSSVAFFDLLVEILATIETVEGEGSKQFNFLTALVTKVESGKPEHAAIEHWLRQAFPQRVLKHVVGQSSAIRLGADIKTPYEMERLDSDRRTLKRALEILDGVNAELEQLIRAQWPSTRRRSQEARS
jgi:chromosome partitioning protein